MTTRFSITITGGRDLSDALKKGASLEDVKRVMYQNGSEFQIRAMYLAPYDTGYLQRSIRLDMLDGGFTARLIPQAHYAIYQEFGTRYQTGKPFIGPAIYAQRGIMKRDLQRLFK